MVWPRRFVVTACIMLCVCRQLTAATIDASTVIGPGDLFGDETLTIVDGVDPPTRVALLEGAIVGDINGEPFIPIGMNVFGQSEVRMLGGGIGGVQRAVLLHEQSLFSLHSGSLGQGGIEALDISRVFLEGGDLTSLDIFAKDSSRVQVNGGEFGAVRGFGSSHIVMTEGSPSDIYLFDDATFVMNGGVLGESLITEGNSRALINSGGASSVVYAKGDSVITFRGGNVTETVVLEDNALLHLYGTDLEFSFDTTQPEIKLVVGFLADGTDVRFSYDPAKQQQIILHEVPEPAAGALLAIGAAGLAWGVRRKQVSCR
jgi:hypothetical protein